MKLPNGQATRHPDANRFIDTIRERLHQAIEIYEKTPLGKIEFFLRIAYVRIFLANITGQVVEIDQEARKALNFIETGTFFLMCRIS